MATRTLLSAVPYVVGVAVFCAGGVYFFAEVISPTFRFVKGSGNAVGDGSVADNSFHFGGARRLAELSKAQLDAFGLIATATRVAAAEERAVRAMAIDASVANTAATTAAAVKQAEIHKDEVCSLASASVKQAEANAAASVANAAASVKQAKANAAASVKQAEANAAASIKQAEANAAASVKQAEANAVANVALGVVAGFTVCVGVALNRWLQKR
jgi:hypothetical protein